jgi:formate hydrogenlyase subunit 3/multisubunit Na+/H+ antiporter MnhD subunit
MIDPSTKKMADHLVIDLGKGSFSWFNRGVLKSVLFLIAGKGLSETWKTRIVTLCNEPEKAPLVMIQLCKATYADCYPELAPHFDKIIETMKGEVT